MSLKKKAIFVAVSSAIRCFDLNGNIYHKNKVDSLVIEYDKLVEKECTCTSLSPLSTSLSKPCQETSPTLVEPFVFLIGSKTVLAKRFALELKLYWKTLKGIPFYDKNYVSVYSSYRPLMDRMMYNSRSFIGSYTTCFVLNLVYFNMFGVEFKYASLSVYVNGSLRYWECRASLFFRYKFLSNVSNLPVVFPNHLVDKTFLDLEEFRDFFRFNKLSLKALRIIVKRRLDISGKLRLKGLYSNRISKFDYLSRVKSREGVKWSHEKYFYSDGYLSRCSVKPLFNPELYSCSSESYVYTTPYTSFFSFNTGGRMSKFCKSFKPEKFIQNSSVHKKDKNWTPGRHKKKDVS